MRSEVMPNLNAGPGGQIGLLIVIVPSKTSFLYTPFKRFCDVSGVPSQCLIRPNVQRKGEDKGFATNVLMKINSKLGGVNVSLRGLEPYLRPATGVVRTPFHFYII